MPELKTLQQRDLQYYAAKAGHTDVTYAAYTPATLNDIADEDGSKAETPITIYYYHPDHLGSNIFITDISGKPYQLFLNLPFGESMAEQSSLGYFKSPYKFNGKELDKETGLYYYGARYYDPRTSLWLSVDPLTEKNPTFSPFIFCNDNPISIVDPDGRSGEPVINKNNNTITVTQHLIFYGGKANSELSGKIATGIASQWNGANGTVKLSGVEYKVHFKVTYETVSEADAKTMAVGNTDIKNNFIRVEDGSGSSKMQLGGNAAWFNTDDDLGGSTTPAHEIGHGFRLPHSITGQTKEVRPDIMTARETPVNPRWSKQGPSNEINPNFRQVTKDEVNSIFKGVSFDKNGKGKIGFVTNKIFKEDGK